MSRRLRRDLHKRISSAGYQKISGDLEVTGSLIGPSMANVVTAIMKIVAGSTTPVQLTITRCEGGYKSIILQWLVQYNLMNFARFEVQASSDESNWYSLKFDGTDWKDTLNADTDVVAPLIVHIPIPFGGTEENPTAVTLYYRMRQVTILGVESAWSATASATTSLIQTGDLAANIVTSNKILTGAVIADKIAVTTLQTLFLKAAYLWIGFAGDGTYDNPNEGDRKIYVVGDEIAFMEFTAGAWSSVNQIKFGGVDTNNFFYPFLQCRGIVNPLADEINLEFFPSAGFRVFNFENDYKDQYGVDDWVSKTRVGFTGTPKKFGSYALKCDTVSSDGDIYTLSIGTIGESQSSGFWYYINANPSIGANLSQISDGPNNNNLYLGIDTSGNVIYFIKKDCVVVANDIDTGFNLSPNQWHYISYSYNKDDDTFTVTVDGNEITSDVLGGSWGVGTFNAVYVVANDYYDMTSYLDELVSAFDIYTNPDIFVQHYNHGLPWNTSYSAKDLVLEPATGGRVCTPTGPIESLAPNCVIMFDGTNWVDNSTMPGWYACIPENSGQGCPDMVDRFVMGKVIAGAGGTGGANAVALSVANLASHTHSMSKPSANHSHAEGSHCHAFHFRGSSGSSGSSGLYLSALGLKHYTTYDVQVSLSVFPFNLGSTGTVSAWHTHTIYSAGSGTAHENRPAYYSMIFIKKVV